MLKIIEPWIIKTEIIEPETVENSWVNKEEINSFFWKVIIGKEELWKLKLNDKIDLFYERLKNYPKIIIISLYKEYYKEYFLKEIKILSPESCLNYIIDFKKFIRDDYEWFHKKLNIIERAINTEWNQPKHQRKYKIYKDEIENYRKRVFQLYNFLKLDLSSLNNIFELNFKNIDNSKELIDKIKGSLDKLETIFYTKILILLNEDNSSDKKWIDKMFSQIFWTLHYWEQKILRDEVRWMLNLSIDKICSDEEFLEKILQNQKNNTLVNASINLLLQNN